MTVVEKLKPVLSVEHMAEFMMREYNTDDYRRSNLVHLETIHDKSYADAVRRLMNGIRAKSKSVNKNNRSRT